MIDKADRFKSLELIPDVLDEGSYLVIHNLGVPFVLDFHHRLLQLSVEVLSNLLEVFD